LEQNIIGGLPLDRFYPELSGCVLLCATEMSKRTDMDRIAETWRSN
jgi:glycine dehydrogenase subunit 1